MTNKIHTPWWSKELAELRRRAKNALNKARKARGSRRKTALRARGIEARRRYTNAVHKAKRNGWRKYCANIRRIPEVARLTRLLEKNPQEMLGALKKEDGSYTENDEEILGMLLEEHFPGIRRATDNNNSEVEDGNDAIEAGRPTTAPLDRGHDNYNDTARERARETINGDRL